MQYMGALILALVALLDHDRFAVRQDAHARLEAMGEPALPYLMASARGSCSPEKTTRLRRLVSPYAATVVASLVSDDVPWIDSLPYTGLEGYYTQSERSDILCSYLGLARGAFDVWENGYVYPKYTPNPRLKQEAPMWPEYRLAFRLWLEDQWSSGRSYEDLKAVVDKMRPRCRFYEKNKGTYPE